jgi:hypothetical protein
LTAELLRQASWLTMSSSWSAYMVDDGLALGRRRAARRARGDHAFEHAPRQDHVQVLGQVDVGDAQAAARLLHDQAYGDHAQQGFANGGAAQLRAFGQVGLNHGCAGLQLQRGDHRFNCVVGDVGGPAFRWRSECGGGHGWFRVSGAGPG